MGGILWGFTLRFRQISARPGERDRYLGRVTSEYILPGYSLKQVRAAWGRIPWCVERQTLLSRLTFLKKCRIPHEGTDWLGGELGDGSKRRKTRRGGTKSKKSGANSLEAPSSETDKDMGERWNSWAGDGGADGSEHHGQPNTGGDAMAPYFSRGKWHCPSAPGAGKKKAYGGMGTTEVADMGEAWR